MDLFSFIIDIELWKALLLVFGLAFVIFEMFHPGFGAPGITGAILLVASIVLISKSFVQSLILIIFILIFLSVILAAVIRSAKKGRLSQILVLDDSLDKQSGYSATEDLTSMLGKSGVALTILRPAGTAIIDGTKFDVVTEGEFINSSQEVKIIKIEGRRVVVKAI